MAKSVLRATEMIERGPIRNGTSSDTNLTIRQVSDKSSHHPKKAHERNTRFEMQNGNIIDRIPPAPNFNVVQCVCSVVRTSVRKMPALMALQNQATLKLGEGEKDN